MILSSELRMLLAFLVALFSALFVIPRLASIARAIGLIDRPDSRKVAPGTPASCWWNRHGDRCDFQQPSFIPIHRGFAGYSLACQSCSLLGSLMISGNLVQAVSFLPRFLPVHLSCISAMLYLVSFGDLFGVGPLVLPDINFIIWAVTIFCVVGVIQFSSTS